MAATAVTANTGDSARETAVSQYRRKVAEHREVEARLKDSKISKFQNSELNPKQRLFCTVRDQLKELTKQYDKSENDLKALQSVGQVRCLLTTGRNVVHKI